jgi:PTS system mannose-specific IIA component
MLLMTETPGAVGVVVVTHGVLATELLNAAETIVGDLPRFAAVSIGWHDDVGLATEAMGRAIARVNTGHGVLLLTDMFGGTPSNLAMTFLEPGKVDVITGVNLPMLIKLARAREEQDLSALARLVCEDGRASIRIASDLLRSSGPKG